MGVARFAKSLGRLFKWAAAAYLIMTAAMLAWTFLWPEPDMNDIESADLIICLGGGMTPDGTLAGPVLTRIERCVQLYDAGHAPFILFSGGTAREGGPSAGRQMVRYAVSLGAPRQVLLEEGRAQSTLQNALFSMDMAKGAQDFIIVTEAFHLPRSGASFRWAQWESGKEGPLTFQLVMSENVRQNAAGDGPNWTMLARESLAIWFNAGRALAYTVAPNRSVDWLH